MSYFISEDDLKTFEGWVRYQGYDPTMLAPDDTAGMGTWSAAIVHIERERAGIFRRLDCAGDLLRLGHPIDRKLNCASAGQFLEHL
jgi:hypothetical protein